jgi:tetratricopeptide (TPR) repeat protein
MKSGFLKSFGVLCVAVFLALPALPAETNSTPNADVLANDYIQLQAQLHAAQLQIEQSREEAAQAAQRNADAMNARIQQLEQTLATQRATEARTQQLTLYVVGTVGIAGLVVLLLAGYLQWRATAQLAQIASHHSAALAAGDGVRQLAAPGRATVEVSSAHLLDIVGQLEKKILELESGGRLLASPPAKAGDLLAEGQRLLDANNASAALECFEKFLSSQPQNAEGLAKKASALEKLGRADEALAFCDRAIGANDSLVIAYLQKGGLLNRLERYEEALKCYEQAMRVQEKKSAR